MMIACGVTYSRTLTCNHIFDPIYVPYATELAQKQLESQYEGNKHTASSKY